MSERPDPAKRDHLSHPFMLKCSHKTTDMIIFSMFENQLMEILVPEADANPF